MTFGRTYESMNELNRWFSSSFPYMLADGGKTLIRVDAVEAITESSDGGSIISLSGGNTVRCAASQKSFIDVMTNRGDR